MKRILSMVLAAVMMMSLMAGCGSEGTPAEKPEEEKNSESVEAVSSEESKVEENSEPAESERAAAMRKEFLSKADEVIVNEDSVTFTDSSEEGTKTIKKNPVKPVCLYGSFTTLWYEAGGTLAGMVGEEPAVSLYKDAMGRDLTQDEGVTVIATGSAGRNWNTETIIGFQPDLIICGVVMDGYSTIKAPAEAAGIPVIAMEYNNLADYLKWFKVFCNLTGHPELWDSVAMKTLDNVMAEIEKAPTENNPTVLSLFANKSSFMANTSNTVIGEMVNELNGKNIVDEWENTEHAERLELNLETVLNADPDVILVQCHNGEENAKKLVEDLYGNDPVWNSLTAVKNGRVYFLQKELFHMKPNHRFDEAYQILTDILYPAN